VKWGGIGCRGCIGRESCDMDYMPLLEPAWQIRLPSSDSRSRDYEEEEGSTLTCRLSGGLLRLGGHKRWTGRSRVGIGSIRGGQSV
jgi:hypothetical protein